MDMKKLTGAFRDYVNKPTKCKTEIIQQWKRAVRKNRKIHSWPRS